MRTNSVHADSSLVFVAGQPTSQGRAIPQNAVFAGLSILAGSEAMPEDEWPDYEDSSEDDTTLIDDDGEDE